MVNVFGINEEHIDVVVYVENVNLAVKQLEKISDVVFSEKFKFISAVGIKIKPDLLKKISKLKNVKYITYGATVTACMDNSLKVINVKKLHSENIFGKGVNIAVIDTGVSNHFDMCFPENKIIAFKDFIGDETKNYDDNGHGTFVSGIICGNGLLSGGKYLGVAPKSKIISVKALDAKGETSALTILQAMQWIFENKNKYKIKVVCMSFGSMPLGASDPLVVGAEALWKHGIVVVCAAGNSGPEAYSIKSPGVSPRIITVGALDTDSLNLPLDVKNFKVAEFSSRGPTSFGTKPDCLAPGVKIKSASNSKEFYSEMSGTSMSTPIVAGVCALLLEKYPQLSPDQIKMQILKSGHKINYNRNAEGAGFVDLSKLNP